MNWEKIFAYAAAVAALVALNVGVQAVAQLLGASPGVGRVAGSFAGIVIFLFGCRYAAKQ